MKETSTDNPSDGIVLRQVTDHIFNCLNRIEENIEHIVFLRRNEKIKDLSEKFYLLQIDRFSRDVLIVFNQILDKDPKASTFHFIINKMPNTNLKNKMRVHLDNLRKEAQTLISHRNKVVAHHDTHFNADLGDYYPAQPFSYFYILNPCFCMRLHNKLQKFIYKLHRVLKINGIGFLGIVGGNAEVIFKDTYLGKAENKKGVQLHHLCKYKDCLLKDEVKNTAKL